MKNTLFSMLIVALLGAGVSQAQTWSKDHTTIHDPNSGAIVEYTSIRSSPDLPFTSRQLVKVEDHLLVIRTTMHDQDGSYAMSIDSISSGERLSIEADFESEMRLSFGDGTLTVGYQDFADSFATIGDYPVEARAGARELLKPVSKEFRGELYALAEVGRYHAIEFNPLTITLMVFFDDLEFVDPVEKPIATSERVADFDPQQHSPGKFERAFGRAYFE